MKLSISAVALLLFAISSLTSCVSTNGKNQFDDEEAAARAARADASYYSEADKPAYLE